MADTPAFVVECYWPGLTADAVADATRRLAGRLADLAVGGVASELLHSTYVPDDESVQWVVRAPTAELVDLACAAAGIEYQRLVPAVDAPVHQLPAAPGPAS